jgi:hypothetical protein
MSSMVLSTRKSITRFASGRWGASRWLHQICWRWRRNIAGRGHLASSPRGRHCNAAATGHRARCRPGVWGNVPTGMHNILCLGEDKCLTLNAFLAHFPLLMIYVQCVRSQFALTSDLFHFNNKVSFCLKNDRTKINNIPVSKWPQWLMEFG